MKKQTYSEIKNPESPGGRKDWEGRSPQERISLTHPQLAILSEIFNEYFNRYPERASDNTYADLADRIAEAMQKIQKPLTKEVELSPLWDEE